MHAAREVLQVTAARDRRTQIVQIVSSDGWAGVGDLVRRFGVSEPSIRRDLELLEMEGLVKRVHGGALSSSYNVQGDIYGQRAAEHLEEKRRIAQEAVALIKPQDSLLLDSGSTVTEVARRIASDLPVNQTIRVVTSSLPAAQALTHRPDIELVVIGGVYAHKYRTMIGPLAVAAMQGLHVDKVFLGAGGLSLESGLTADSLQEIEGLHALSLAADKVVVVADSSKVERRGMAVVMPLEDIDVLVTDSAAPPHFVDALQKLGVEVRLVCMTEAHPGLERENS